MEYSLKNDYDSNNQEMTNMKQMVNFSLENNPEPYTHFETINNVNVPVNQALNLEMTRFKDKQNIYRNPNLKIQSSKSAVELQSNSKNFFTQPAKSKQIKKPPVFMNTNAVKFIFFFICNF
jgi:hypothetical protein